MRLLKSVLLAITILLHFGNQIVYAQLTSKSMTGNYLCGVGSGENNLPNGMQVFTARDKVVFKNGIIKPCNNSNSGVIIKTDNKIIPQIAEGNVAGSDSYTSTNNIAATYYVDKTKPTIFTSGSASVSPTGAASYSIPIIIPPGSGGMIPSISIAYNSQSGNGIAGFGWDISGLSAIHRTPPTIYNDGNIVSNAINFSINDKISLDGQRLYAKPGTGSYWTENTVYETEAINFSTVTQKKAADNAIWFEVKGTDGKVYEYGRTDDSRLYSTSGSTSQILIWKINKVTDINGNYMLYSYVNGKAISRIEYTGNSVNGIKPYNSIEFTYSQKPDVNVGYVNGYKTTQDLLLNSIVVKNEQTRVRKYELDYSKDIYSKLAKVIESDGYNSELNPTLLYWDGEINSNVVTDNPTTIFDNITNYKNTYTGDFNGDNKADIVIAHNDTWKMYVSNYDFNGYSLVDYNFSYPTGYETFDHLGFTVFDINNDGRDDLIESFLQKTTGGTYKLSKYLHQYNFDDGINSTEFSSELIWYGDISFKATSYILNGDFDNDKKIDYGIFYSTNSKCIQISNAFSNAFQSLNNEISKTGIPGIYCTGKLHAMDFNGNGKTDIFTKFQVKGFKIMEYDKENDKFITISTSINPDLIREADDIYPGDFNGDGKTDILKFNALNKYYEVLFSNGVTFTDKIILNNISQTSPNLNFDNENILLGDFNGDGITDFSYLFKDAAGNAKQQIYSLSGNTFKIQEVLLSSSNIELKNICLGDFNGDSKADIIFAGGTKRIAYSYLNTNFLKLKQVTNGFGKIIKFEYKNLTQYGSFYYPSNMDIPPNAKVGFGFELFNKDPQFRFPFIAVSSMSDSDGLGGFNTMDYSYRGGYVDENGKGFLGFKEFKTFNRSINNRTITKYEKNSTYNIMFLVSQSDNFSLNEQIITYSSGGQTNPNRYISYVSSKTSLDKLRNFTQTQTSEYDESNGNLKKHTTTYGTEGSVVVDYTYLAAPIAGMQRVDIETITKKRTGKPDYIRSVKYEYDALGRTKKTIADPDLISYVSEIKRRDAWGNVLEVELSGGDIPVADNRTQTTEYDIYGRFAIKSTNPMGQFATAKYDGRFGVVIESTGIDNLTTYSTYDSWGRSLSEKGTDGVTTYINYAFTNSAPITSAFHQVSRISAGSPASTVYLDVLSRTVYSQTEGTDGNIVSQSVYNNLGQLLKTSVPKYSGTDQWVEYHYDNYGRTDWTKDRNRQTTFSYNGATTIVTTPDAKTSSQTTNVFGEVVSSTDKLGKITTYTYKASGAVETISHEGVVTTMDYDAYNNRKSLDEKGGSGLIEYTYNTFGELKTQKDAKGTYTFTYDKLGRLTAKTGIDSKTYTYVSTGANGIGQLKEMLASNGEKITYNFDELGRTTQETQIIDGNTFVTAYTYSNNKLDQITYPNNFKLKHIYDAKGYLLQLKNGTTNTSIWKRTSVNALGQLVSATLGNGLSVTNGYDSYGLPTTMKAGTVFDYEVNFDPITGNLNYRKDNAKLLHERFTYDNLDRLASAILVSSNNQTTNYTFDSRGNITNKSDAATTYNYKTGDQKDVLDNLTGLVLDAIPSAEQILTYTSFSKVATVSESGKTLSITYGADEQRSMMTQVVNGVTTKTYYVGNYEKQVNVNTGEIIERTYVFSPFGLVAMVHKKGTNAETINYTHTDHLGSVLVLSDNAGVPLASFSYDAWGKRRDPINWESYKGGARVDLLTRGFTFHEHIDNFGLINMNGRMYDPTLGRFLSPDPILHIGDSPYSYAGGNPLKYIDPTGEFLTWSFSNGGFSVGLNFGLYGFGVNVGWGNGASLGVYGEVGPRLLGTGFGTGATISQSYDYNFTHDYVSTTYSSGAYASIGPFMTGGSVSATYNYASGDWSYGWGVYAGLGIGNEKGGIGATVGYGSGGFTYGIGGNGDSGYSWVNGKYQSWQAGRQVVGAESITFDEVEPLKNPVPRDRDCVPGAISQGDGRSVEDLKKLPGYQADGGGDIEMMGKAAGYKVHGVKGSIQKDLFKFSSKANMVIANTTSGDIHHATTLKTIWRFERANGKYFYGYIVADPAKGTYRSYYSNFYQNSSWFLMYKK